MSTQVNLKQRFFKVLMPTKPQALVSVFVALGILIVAQRPSFVWLSSTDQGPIVEASVAYLHDRVAEILTSQIAATTALIGFWAVVGLVAYLVCWMVYNLFIEARNKVTLKIRYTNRGRWRGAGDMLILKTLSALALCAAIVVLEPSIRYWSKLVTPILSGFSLWAGLLVGMAIFALALQLYLILTAAILTFSAWYRPEAFTDGAG